MIFMKMFGKSKIYCLAQDMKFEVDESVYTDEIDKAQDQNIDDKVLRYLKWNLDLHNTQLTELKEESKILDSKLSVYENQMTVEELNRAIKDLKATIKEFENRDKVEVVNPTEFAKRKKEHASVKKEFLKRSNLFKEMINSLCDGLNKKKKELFKEIGMEE